MTTIGLILYTLLWLFARVGVIFIVYKLEIKHRDTKNKKQRNKDNE